MTPEDTTQSREDEIIQSKSIEFYSQGVNAWFSSALEHDKSLLTLSVAGIGFLVSWMSTETKSIEGFLLYGVAIFSFLICLLSILTIFKRNKTHILNVFNGKEEPDLFLKILDIAASVSFFFGIFFSSILGLLIAFRSYT